MARWEARLLSSAFCRHQSSHICSDCSLRRGEEGELGFPVSLYTVNKFHHKWLRNDICLTSRMVGVPSSWRAMRNSDCATFCMMMRWVISFSPNNQYDTVMHGITLLVLLESRWRGCCFIPPVMLPAWDGSKVYLIEVFSRLDIFFFPLFFFFFLNKQCTEWHKRSTWKADIINAITTKITITKFVWIPRTKNSSRLRGQNSSTVLLTAFFFSHKTFKLHPIGRNWDGIHF